MGGTPPVLQTCSFTHQWDWQCLPYPHGIVVSFYESIDASIDNVIPEHFAHIRVHEDFKTHFLREGKESFVMANGLQMKLLGGLNDRFCQIESNIIITQREDDQILGTIEASGSCEGSEPNIGSHSITNMVKSYLGPHAWKHSFWLMPL